MIAVYLLNTKTGAHSLHDIQYNIEWCYNRLVNVMFDDILSGIAHLLSKLDELIWACRHKQE